jgi:phenylacetate-CoA ligase
MRKSQWLSHDQIQTIQQMRLERLLIYAYDHVPYYKGLFDQVGLIKDGRVHMQHFNRLPLLDKPTIRANFKVLTSDEVAVLKTSENRTGGSTGEPLVFLQDREGVRISGGAVLRMFYEWHDIAAGDREIKLWGSEADIFYSARFTLKTLRDWLSGIITLNAFRMTPKRMREYVDIINTFQPKLLRGYSSNLFELAQFAEENNLNLRPPKAVISSAGTLYAPLQEKMEAVYGCRVYNHYGSREMHNIAMECPQGHMHISAFTHLIEVLDEQNQPCPHGVEGDLVVTSLVNFAMPFIRYRIGDRGALTEEICSCGRGLPLLEKLSGRIVNSFRTDARRIVPGEYFIHMLGVHMQNHSIAKFQVIQRHYNEVLFKLVMRPGFQLPPPIESEIEEKTRLVMGDSCHMTFEFVEDIPPAANGKYFYTVCQIPDLLQPEQAANPHEDYEHHA